MQDAALWQGEAIVQIATTSSEHGARAQSDFMEDFGARLGGSRPSVLASRSFPDVVEAGDLLVARPDSPSAVLGVHDITGAPAVVDLTWSNLTIIGPPPIGKDDRARDVRGRPT